jgi:hypothetical protein
MSGEYPEELKMGEGDEGPVHKKHYPNLLNTCVFLVETSQQVSVMAVNYKGRPFMLGTTENAALLWSLALCAIGLFVAVNEVVPELNTYLGLVPFPNEDIRRGVVVCVAVSMFGSFIWDRICLFFFARHIFMASLQEAKETKLSDYYPQLKKVGIALAVLAWLGLFQGNVLVLGECRLLLPLHPLTTKRFKKLHDALLLERGRMHVATIETCREWLAMKSC